MNGAENLLETLVRAGMEVCFANPGTSEMHLVAAIGRTQRMRSVLCLFEGVASGAADGYARMSDKPALTLLHLGSGFSNSMANQHNAMRAHVPLVNMVGDHATYHLKYDAPLTSDVPAHARIVSDFVRISESADDLALAGAEAVRASMNGAGKVATFIAPANHAWDQATQTVAPLQAAGLECVAAEAIAAAAERLGRGKRTVLFLGGRALREDSLRAAGKKVGLLRPRLFRPLPAALLRQWLQGRRAVAVIDQNISMGMGGILHSELASALYGIDKAPLLASYIGGLGGRDISQQEFFAIADELHQAHRQGTAPPVRLLYTRNEMTEMRKLQAIAQAEHAEIQQAEGKS